MLTHLTSKAHELVCTAEVDETGSTRKWNKKAPEHLQKLNKDCNMTAGLEAKFSLTVGARVMLCRNVNTKTGLVNGAIGTVLSITVKYVTVQFDHISEPYNVEKVKSRFMVMKNYVYAVTVHKCQGLSLDCAIVDLSDQVFSAGMAYVALSRIQSLSGLYLAVFDPKSIIVSASCLKKDNQLRETYRKDLPLYPVPLESRTGTKRNLKGTTEHDQSKKGRINPATPSKPVPRKGKRRASSKPEVAVATMSLVGVHLYFIQLMNNGSAMPVPVCLEFHGTE